MAGREKERLRGEGINAAEVVSLCGVGFLEKEVVCLSLSHAMLDEYALFSHQLPFSTFRRFLRPSLSPAMSMSINFAKAVAPHWPKQRRRPRPASFWIRIIPRSMRTGRPAGPRLSLAGVVLMFLDRLGVPSLSLSLSSLREG